MCTRGRPEQHGKPRDAIVREKEAGGGSTGRPRGLRAGRNGVAERPVVLRKPGNAGGGKGPWFERAQNVARDRRLGDLITPEKVQKLQRALQAKAKEAPQFRFYALYDKVCREDVLHEAYRRCRSKNGAAGVDAERFEDIEAYGVERWLGELREALRRKEYEPQAVKRVYVPKPNGSLRPLGIPTIRDRVVQTAATLVLEAIFEADMPPEQYAYRANRSALDAIRQVHGLVNLGYRKVIEADLRDYFGSIPHAELLRCVARRIVDRHVLHLIRMWLTAAVEQSDERGRKWRTTQSRDTRRGIPQGAPISPLLSNLYMRRFVLGWEGLGLKDKFGAYIVNYADDLVICCNRQAEEALHMMRRMMHRLGLTVNEEKTRICCLPGKDFDFLGYTIGRCYTKTGHPILGTRPSKKSVQRLKRAISAATHKRTLQRDVGDVVEEVNRMMRGWARYFCLGPVSKAYNDLDRHAVYRLSRWFYLKHKRTRRAPRLGIFRERLGLLWLPGLTKSFPWANA
jgi:RNA-directed DNA polymerase